MVTSVAALLAGFVSLKAVGAATVAVLVNTPTALAAMVAVTVNETVPPASRSTTSTMSPIPDAVVHADPGVATHVQATPANVAGMVSTTGTPVAADGPLLVTTML